VIGATLVGSDDGGTVVLWVKLTKLTADSFVIFAIIGVLGFRSRGILTKAGEIRGGGINDLFDRINTLNNRIKLTVKEALYKAVESF